MKTKEYSDNNGNVFMADKLLPCPLCGSQAGIMFIGNNATKSRKVTIKCSAPHCRIERTDATIHHDHEWCAKTCIESWNKRVPMESYAAQKVQEEMERIEKWLDKKESFSGSGIMAIKIIEIKEFLSKPEAEKVQEDEEQTWNIKEIMNALHQAERFYDRNLTDVWNKMRESLPTKSKV